MPEAETRSGMMGMMPVHFATMYVTSYGTVLVDRPVRRGSQRDLRIVGWDLRIIGYVRHGVWRQTKVLSKQRVLGHDAQLPAITYNHFGTYIHMYHGSGNDFTDLRIDPLPPPLVG